MKRFIIFILSCCRSVGLETTNGAKHHQVQSKVLGPETGAVLSPLQFSHLEFRAAQEHAASQALSTLFHVSRNCEVAEV